MTKPLPKALAAILVAVLLLCSVTVAGTLFHQAAMTEQISQLQANLDAVQGRLRKQQAEYAEYIALLPQIELELAAIQPQADEAYAREQALRQQRKDLRAENAALAAELEPLLALTDAASAEASAAAQAVTALQDALNALEEIGHFFQ